METDGLALFIAEPPQANITTIIIRLVCKDGYLFFGLQPSCPVRQTAVFFETTMQVLNASGFRIT